MAMLVIFDLDVNDVYDFTEDHWSYISCKKKMLCQIFKMIWGAIRIWLSPLSSNGPLVNSVSVIYRSLLAHPVL